MYLDPQHWSDHHIAIFFYLPREVKPKSNLSEEEEEEEESSEEQTDRPDSSGKRQFFL